jgi:hypothetical protein
MLIEAFCAKTVTPLAAVLNDSALVGKFFLPCSMGGFGLSDPDLVLASAYLASVSSTARFCCKVSVVDADDPPDPPDGRPPVDPPVPAPPLRPVFSAVPLLPDVARLQYVGADFLSQSSRIRQALLRLVSDYHLDPEAWDRINAEGMVMPLDFNAFVQVFSNPSTKIRKIQRAINHELTRIRFESIKASFDASADRAQQRRQWHMRQSGAHLWALVLPTTQDLVLSNIAYHIAVQNSFGFCPVAYAPGRVRVKCCNSPNCNVNLLEDLQHPFSCKPVMKRGRNIQHNNVQTILERLVRACGGRVEHPEHLSLALDNPNERPDFMVSMLRDSFLVDVRGVHPLATTYLGRNCAEVYLEEAFRQKQEKYDAIRQLHHLPTVPVVFTTSGDVYSESLTFFARMKDYFIQNDPDAGQLGGPSADATVFYYKTALSVAIMRDNANIICATHGRDKLKPIRDRA